MRKLFIGLLVGLFMITLSMAALFGSVSKNEGEIELSKQEIDKLDEAGFDTLVYGNMSCDDMYCITPIMYLLDSDPSDDIPGQYFGLAPIKILKGTKTTSQLITETQAKTADVLRARLVRYDKEKLEKEQVKQPVAEGGTITLKEKK